MSFAIQPALNAALWQNHVPVLAELAFQAGEGAASTEVEVALSCEPPVIRPRSWRLSGVAAGQLRSLAPLDVELDGAFLSSLTEATRARVSLVATGAGGTALAEAHEEVRVLAYNEWGGCGGIPDILAAFVEPNDPAVPRLLRATSDKLRAAGKNDGLDGYQQGSKPRAWEQAEALWRAVCALDIRYTNPPASFEREGQRIRPPRQVMEERLGTCLDLAVLFASALEAMGLRPVIVLVRGHAFPGLWLSKHDFGASRADDAPGLRTRLALHDIVLFESTLAAGSGRVGFGRACAVGAARVAADKDTEFEAVIDVARARSRRIQPLSARAPAHALRDTTAEVQDEVVLDLPPEEAPPLREDAPPEAEAPPGTPAGRLEQWRKRLLDLSGRNRLLNLRTGGKQALAVDCPDPGALENLLAEMRAGRGGRAGPALRFRPWPELMSGDDPRSARLARNRLQEETDRAFAREALGRRELLVGRDDASLQAGLTEIFRAARANREEGGANTLFLTIGALVWRQKGREAPFRAPILLVPVVLERPSIRSGFSLRAHDDETRLNSTLLEMLRQEFDIRFPTLEMERPPEDESGADVAAILDAFRTKVRDIPGWEVAEDVALTNLSFTKYLMWKDLADRAEALRGSEVAQRLMDGPGTGGTAPAFGGEDGETVAPPSLDEATAGLACPLESDSSQLRAVAAAASGRSFVLIGPPGTGKSQTIANIIASTLAQGRTVLFVAEKRAALEVVQRRLRQVGLGEFCLDLFSSKTSKAAVLAQLDQAQQVREARAEHDWDTALAEAAALREELNGYVRALHQRGRNGWTPFRAMGHVLRAEGGAVPELRLSWPDADAHDAGDYLRLRELVEDAAATLERMGGLADAAPLAGVEATEWSPPWQSRVLDGAMAAAAALDALPRLAAEASLAAGLRDGGASRPALAALDALAAVLLDRLAPEAGWALGDDAAAIAEALREEATRAARHAELRAGLSAKWRPEATGLPVAALRGEWLAAAGKWVVARALAWRGLRKRLAGACDGPVPEDCGPDLGRLAEMAELEAASRAAGAPLSRLGPAWRGFGTDFARLDACIEWARALRAAAASCAANPTELLELRAGLRLLVTEGADLLAPSGSIGAALLRFRDALRAAEAALDALALESGADPRGVLDGSRTDWAGALAAHLRGWPPAAARLKDWTSWRGIAQRAEAAGLAPLIRALEDGRVAPADAARVFEANYARWWVGLAVEASPRLRSFVAARHETRIARFRALDAHLLALSTRLVRARLAAGLPGEAEREGHPEYAVLKRELAKRRAHLPLRQLAARMPRALRRLTPCLMMSPLSVAQYLPADAEPFDLVVFDEASQIPTWDAVGALGRGRQAVVVGDPKQLPPTRFFERVLPEAEGGEGVETEVQDLESILDECLGAGVPAVELLWHYRSRHESLIAFSNESYYGGRLVTFPSPMTEDAAVSFRHVAGGVYARAGARTNQVEARAVVAEALSVLRATLAGGPERSLGIVTFNAEQQALIENLLDEARRDDPALEPFFAEERAEPVLVKNLESVQGEERDVMLFSLTYGPDATGRVAMNFGPLNQAGGERRLNVAVTRAREALVVFASLRPDQIDLARTAATGVAHLKRFLTFAQLGARAFAVVPSAPGGEVESPFEAAVAERLRAKGWTVHAQVGVSGFRVDLGVVDPDRPGAYLAGVECDGATYHRGATARDRDRLRQAVLEGLGWHVLRVWSTDWWVNAAREAERLHAALEERLTASRERRREEAAPQAEAGGPADGAADAPPAGEAAPDAAEGDDDRAWAGDADAARFYDADYRDTLAAMVAAAVASHGPIRKDRLIQRMARAHGFKRAGREIQERVEAAIPASLPQTRDSAGTFVWPAGVDPEAAAPLRRGERGPADPAEVPIERLRALARELGAAARPGDDLLLAMQEACGVKALRSLVRERLQEAVDAARVTGG
ncbi:DUF3320 domain-containing protein [Roseococcus sp. DSY-14]|uniref:DUF3320 domain-containing protein n=1 Tax=Roseococcus sp. DSY-14 TaxID=3369650 RepID=UPI00387AA279